MALGEGKDMNDQEQGVGKLEFMISKRNCFRNDLCGGVKGYKIYIKNISRKCLFIKIF